MFAHDSFFFIGVFIFIFLVWIIMGGPAHPISFTGPLLANPGPLGGGTYLSLPSAPGIGGGGVGESHATNGALTSISGQLSQTNSQVKNLQNQISQTISFGPPSPYRGEVTLGGVSSAGTQDVQNEYVQVFVSSNASAPVSLSGWVLKSDVTGTAAIIPQGTEVPRSGVINESQPVLLNPGDRAIVSSGRSPIGASFRENKCIGYFAEFQKFSPALPNSCPTPNSELDTAYGPSLARDPTCIDYVDRLSRCSVILSPPTGLTNSCQSFLISRLNYNGCVLAHQNDPDFKTAEWRVYLGRDASLWRGSRETVKLLDNNGKTVDLYSY